MRMNQLWRTTRGWGKPGQDRRTSIWRPTPLSCSAEKQSWRILRTKASSLGVLASILCGYPLQNNVQLTNLIVSSPMIRRTSRCVAICYMQLAPQKRLGLFVTTLTCSSCSSTGHGGRLSGRTSRWRSGKARCLTYVQQWTRWETRVASCSACTPCQAVTTSPTPTARARRSLWKYWWTMTSMACNLS